MDRMLNLLSEAVDRPGVVHDALVAIEQEVVDCRALPAAGRVARAGRGREAGGVPRRDVLGPAGARASATRRRAIVVLGLAPAAHGANRTGRVFTGDRSGDWLFRAMHRAGLANQPTSVARRRRAAPPRRVGHGGGEVRAAGQRADARASATRARRSSGASSTRSTPAVVVCLGAFGYDAACRHFGVRPRPRFGHGVEVAVDGGPTLLCSFHPSQQNTFTGRLTEPMLDAVFDPVDRAQPADAAAVNAVCTASAANACAERASSSRPNIEKNPWIWPSKRTCVVATPASASRAA